MYKSSFYLKIFYFSLIILIGIIYYIYSKSIIYFLVSISLAIWLIYYLKHLEYSLNNKFFIKKSGRFFRVERRLNIDKIISLSHYNLKILKLNILIIKHLEGRMLITFLLEKDIRDIIEGIENYKD